MNVVEITAMLGVCASLMFFAVVCKPVESDRHGVGGVDGVDGVERPAA